MLSISLCAMCNNVYARCKKIYTPPAASIDVGNIVLPQLDHCQHLRWVISPLVCIKCPTVA